MASQGTRAPYLRPMSTASRSTREPSSSSGRKANNVASNYLHASPSKEPADRTAVAVHGARGCFYNECMLVFGGQSCSGAALSDVRFMPLFGDGPTGWTIVDCGLANGVKSRPGGRRHAITAVFRGVLFVIGGENAAGQLIADAWTLSLGAVSRLWSPIRIKNSMLLSTRCAVTELCAGVIITQGGYGPDGTVSSSLVVINLATKQMRLVGEVGGQAGLLVDHEIAVCASRGTIYLFGGHDTTGAANPNIVEVFVDLSKYTFDRYAKRPARGQPKDDDEGDTVCPTDLPSQVVCSALPRDFCPGYPMVFNTGASGSDARVLWAGPASTWGVTIPPTSLRDRPQPSPPRAPHADDAKPRGGSNNGGSDGEYDSDLDSLPSLDDDDDDATPGEQTPAVHHQHSGAASSRSSPLSTPARRSASSSASSPRASSHRRTPTTRSPTPLGTPTPEAATTPALTPTPEPPSSPAVEPEGSPTPDLTPTSSGSPSLAYTTPETTPPRSAAATPQLTPTPSPRGSPAPSSTASDAPHPAEQAEAAPAATPSAAVHDDAAAARKQAEVVTSPGAKTALTPVGGQTSVRDLMLRPDTPPDRAEWVLCDRGRTGIPPLRDVVSLNHAGRAFFAYFGEPTGPAADDDDRTSSQDGSTAADDDDDDPAGSLFTFFGAGGWQSRPITYTLSKLHLPPVAKPPKAKKHHSAYGGRVLVKGQQQIMLPAAPPSKRTASAGRRPATGAAATASSPSAADAAMASSHQQSSRSAANERRRLAMLTPAPPPEPPKLAASASAGSVRGQRTGWESSTALVVRPPSRDFAASTHPAPRSASRRAAQSARRHASRDVSRIVVAGVASSKPATARRSDDGSSSSQQTKMRAAVAIRRAVDESSVKAVDLSRCCRTMECDEMLSLRSALSHFPRLARVDVSAQQFDAFLSGLLVETVQTCAHVLRVDFAGSTLPSVDLVESLEASLRTNLRKTERRLRRSMAKRHHKARREDLLRHIAGLDIDEWCGREAVLEEHAEAHHRLLIEGNEGRGAASIACHVRECEEQEQQRLAVERARVAAEIVAECQRAMAEAEHDVLQAHEAVGKVETKERTDLKRQERAAWSRIMDRVRQQRKQWKLEREEVDREERARRTDVRFEEDRFRQLFTAQFVNFDSKYRLWRESLKRLEAQREADTRRERERIRALEEAQRQEEAERLRKRKFDQDKQRNEEETVRNGHVSDERHTWQRLMSEFRDGRMNIDRRDNYLDRCRQRDEAGLVPPVIAVTEMPSSARIVQASCAPTPITRIVAADVDPSLGVTLGEKPGYFEDGGPAARTSTAALRSGKHSSRTGGASNARRASRAVAPSAAFSLEPGEITKEAYTAQKTAILGGTITASLGVNPSDGLDDLYITLSHPQLDLRGDVRAESDVEVFYKPIDISVASVKWNSDDQRLHVHLTPAAGSYAIVSTLLASVALHHYPFAGGGEPRTPQEAGMGGGVDGGSVTPTASHLKLPKGAQAAAGSTPSSSRQRRGSTVSNGARTPTDSSIMPAPGANASGADALELPDAVKPTQPQYPMSLSVDLRVELEFPVYRSADAPPPPSMADLGEKRETGSPLLARTKSKADGLKRRLNATWGRTIDTQMYPPIVTMNRQHSLLEGMDMSSGASLLPSAADGGTATPRQAAAHHGHRGGSTAPVYTEGDGEVTHWPYVSVLSSDLLPSLSGAMAFIAIDNDCDALDALVLRTITGGGITVNDHGGAVAQIVADGEVIADVVQKGPMVYANTIVNAATGEPFEHQPEIRPRPRKVGPEKAAQFKLRSSCTVPQLTKLMRMIRFINTSKNPAEGTRRLQFGLTYANGLQSVAQIEFIVVGIDDPTVIDMGASVIPYRLAPEVPEQLEDHVTTPPCYFASACSVFDVDTTDFTGGFLKVTLTNPRRGDVLAFDPPPGSSLDVAFQNNSESQALPTVSMIGLPPVSIETVTYKDVDIASVETSSDSSVVTFTFKKASIDAVESIFKSMTFSIPQQSLTQLSPTELYSPRLVVFSLKCGQADPVHASCRIGVSKPLLSMGVSTSYFWTYKEKSDLQPVGSFAVCQEDEGWDGGFVTVEIVEGHDPDDVVILKEGDGIRLRELSESALPQPPTKSPDASPRNSVAGGSAGSRRRRSDSIAALSPPASLAASTAGATSGKEPTSPASADGGGPAAAAAATSPSAAGEKRPDDLKTLWRNRATDKVRQLAQARQRTHDDLRMRVMEQVRQNRKGTIVGKHEYIVEHHGHKIGTLTQWPGGATIQFNPQRTFDSSKPRASLCQVRRRDVAAVVRNIVYRNVNDNMRSDQYKVIRVRTSDGLPHASDIAVKVQLEPIDDVTEMRRLDNDPRIFRAQGFEDESGFAFFDDVTLYDPDTFAFNGAVLRVELASGGDLRFDQLGVLTARQQQVRGVEPKNFLSVSLSERLSIGSKVIGHAVIEAASAAAPSSLEITFEPYPTGKGIPPKPSSLEELAGNPHAVSILEVERVLQSITFTSTASHVKAGMRIYQAHLKVDNNDSRIKSWIDVLLPLVTLPEYGADLQFREGRPPLPVFSKAQLSFDAKTQFKAGEITATIAKGRQEGADKLELSIGKSPLSINKNAVWNGKDYVGALQLSDGTITLSLDWASKATIKTIQHYVRCIAYMNTSQDPTTDTRHIELILALEKNAAPSKAVAHVAVVAEDNPTEVTLQQQKIEVVRAGKPVLVCDGASVTDPDTQHFYEPSYVLVEMVGGNPTCDTVWISGLAANRPGHVLAHKDAPAVPPRPANFGGPTAMSPSQLLASSTSSAMKAPFSTSKKSALSISATSQDGASNGAADGDSDPTSPRCSNSISLAASIPCVTSDDHSPPPASAAAEGPHIVPGENKKQVEVPLDGRRVVAFAEPIDGGKRSGVLIRLHECTLEELQDLVRRLYVQCTAGGPRDREARRIIQISVQSGTAPVFRTSVGVDILPTLMELPTMISANGVVFSGAPVDPYGTVTIPGMHCSNGAVASIFISDKTEAELASSTLTLSLTSKHGLTLKDPSSTGGSGASSSSKPRPSIAASASSPAAPGPGAPTSTTGPASGTHTHVLLHDGKRVGTATFHGKHRIVAKLSGTSAGVTAQKLLRSVSFVSVNPLESEIVIGSTLRDNVRDIEFGLGVIVAAPGTMKPLTKRADSVSVLRQVSKMAARSTAAIKGMSPQKKNSLPGAVVTSGDFDPSSSGPAPAAAAAADGGDSAPSRSDPDAAAPAPPPSAEAPSKPPKESKRSKKSKKAVDGGQATS